MGGLVPLEWSCRSCNQTFSTRMSLEEHLQAPSHKSIFEIRELLFRTSLSLAQVAKLVGCSEENVGRIERSSNSRELLEQSREGLLEKRMFELFEEHPELVYLREACVVHGLEFLLVFQDSEGTKFLKNVVLINGWMCRILGSSRHYPVSLDIGDVEFTLISVGKGWFVIPISRLQERSARLLQGRDWSQYLNAWGPLKKHKMLSSTPDTLPEDNVGE